MHVSHLLWGCYQRGACCCQCSPVLPALKSVSGPAVGRTVLRELMSVFEMMMCIACTSLLLPCVQRLAWLSIAHFCVCRYIPCWL